MTELQDYYKHFLGSLIKDKKALQDQILYNLFKKPQRDTRINTPHIDDSDFPPNTIQQADILYLPDDSGYKYGLVVVDTVSRKCDCEPMKAKDSKTTLKSIQTIYKRGIISQPKTLQVDSGSEFKGDFAKYFFDRGINIRYAEPYRSRQQALAESRNASIAKPLLFRMTAEELLTGEASTSWTHFLPQVIKFLNERFEVKYKKPKKDQKIDYDKIFGDPKCEGKACDLLDVGTTVRYQLDKPINLLDEKRLHGGFRLGDVRWSIKPTVIERLQIVPNQPPLYKVKGRTCLYTRNQLQVVSPNAKLPPASVQHKYIIEKIVGKKKIKGNVYYQIKWKSYPESQNTWEPRSELIKDVPQLVESYDSQ